MSDPIAFWCSIIGLAFASFSIGVSIDSLLGAADAPAACSVPIEEPQP